MWQRVHTAAVLGVPFLLAVVAPAPAESFHALSAASSTDPTAPLLAAVAVAAWACSAWLLVVIALTGGSALPGALGRLAASASTRIAPRAVRHAVRVAVGVSIVGSTLSSPAAWAADAATPAPTSSAAVRTATPTTAGPSLDWPVTSTAPASATSGSSAAGRASAPTTREQPARRGPTLAPTTPGPASPPPGAGPSSTAPAVSSPAPFDASRTRGAAPVGTRSTPVVVVQPGDCLWDLAAEALGEGATDRQIARAWPRWWSTNRAVLGESPDLLHPGTPLQPPPAP